MAMSKTRTLSMVLVGLGLLLNPWTLGKLLAEDGTIDGAVNILSIVLAEAALVLLAAVLRFRRNALRYLLGGVVSALVVLTAQRVLESRAPRAQPEKKEGEKRHDVLRSAVLREKTGMSMLDYESAEILYALHQPTEVLRFEVPERGILDTGIGFDPMFREIVDGAARFEIALRQAEGDFEVIFSKSFNLRGSDKDLRTWQHVTVDLSAYAGHEVVLAFNKSFTPAGSSPPADTFGVGPADLMFWRKPRVRPQNLEGRKNVILVSLDTVRADHLHYMGYQRETSPTLDRLAREGVYFTNCISQAPWTTPSHFSILTSTYPTTHGANQPVQNKSRRWNVRLPTMAEILVERGYSAVAFTGRGSISAEYGFLKGFDFYNETKRDDATGGDVEGVTAKAVRWLRRNKSRTFFLFFHTYEPHAPYDDDHYVADAGQLSAVEEKIARYDGDIRRADAYLGKLIEALEELSLLDDTLLVVTSDHGEELDEARWDTEWTHGHSLYDELLEVPLIFHGLGGDDQGVRVDHQVRSIDVLPTILDDLGISGADSTFQGESLRGMIEGTLREPLPAYSEATTYGTERESLRSGGYKYIHRRSYGRLIYSDSLGLRMTPVHELYDLDQDPGETRNLAPENTAKVEEMIAVIGSVFPERGDLESASAGKEDASEPLLDLNQSPELLETLRSLGYID